MKHLLLALVFTTGCQTLQSLREATSTQTQFAQLREIGLTEDQVFSDEGAPDEQIELGGRKVWVYKIEAFNKEEICKKSFVFDSGKVWDFKEIGRGCK